MSDCGGPPRLSAAYRDKATSSSKGERVGRGATIHSWRVWIDLRLRRHPGWVSGLLEPLGGESPPFPGDTSILSLWGMDNPTDDDLPDIYAGVKAHFDKTNPGQRWSRAVLHGELGEGTLLTPHEQPSSFVIG